MVFERVKKVVASELDIEESKVTKSARFVEDLGADSIDALELIIALEDEFDIEISDDDAQDIKTVGDVVAYIEKLV
ncbi:MAG TPA: acyl carrier protein [Acholeplasma sp.]|jgi:acyl carrier protein|nr:acyl carrier protein [Acholeplasma sp.]